MREFEITRARKSDAEALAALEAVCFPPEEAATLAGFEARLDAFGDWFFVAKTPDGEIIGMIDGMATDEASIADEMFEDASLHKPNGRVQTVFGLDVLPQWRHRGVAGALMDAFVEAAKQAGREKVTLTCKKRLIGMYEHFGFRLIGRRAVSTAAHSGSTWIWIYAKNRTVFQKKSIFYRKSVAFHALFCYNTGRNMFRRCPCDERKGNFNHG